VIGRLLFAVISTLIISFTLNLPDSNLFATQEIPAVEETQNKETTSANLISQAEVQRKRGNLIEAGELADRGLKLARSIDSNEQITRALQELVAIEKQRRDQALMDLRLFRERSYRNAAIAGIIALGVIIFFLYIRRADAARIAEELSLSDSLTGLRNRRFVQQAIGYDLATSLRKYRGGLFTGSLPRHADVVFMLLDLDGFKSINDRHGNSAGDEILKQIGKLLQDTCRSTDTVACWGGEEFLIISRFTNREDAGILAERLRNTIASSKFEVKPGEQIQCTCSIGFSAFPFIQSKPDSLTWEQVLGFADDALFIAKRSGKNAWLGIYASSDMQVEPMTERTMADLKKWIDEKQLITLTSLTPEKIQL
jgi:diguanylate cyclase (GGDEF)-like protein